MFVAQPKGVAGVLCDVDGETLLFTVGGELDNGIERLAAGVFHLERLATRWGGGELPLEEGGFHSRASINCVSIFIFRRNRYFRVFGSRESTPIV